MDALMLRSSWSPAPAAAPLRLRASWSPLAAVAVASNRARAARHLILIDQGRRDVYLTRTRGAFRSHCHKDVDEPDLAESSENLENPLCEQLRKNREAFRAAMGVRVAPDMFIKEKNKITNYIISMSSSGVDILNVNATVLAQNVCASAQTALDLASQVMDIANVGLGITKTSEHSTNQMVRTYTTIFLNVAEDAYYKRVEMETIISFLDALRGLGTICHMLVEDIVDKLEDGTLKDSITCSMDDSTQEFDKQVNSLKMAATMSGAHKIVTDILFDGTRDAHLYLFQLVECRKAALYQRIMHY